MTKAIGRAAGGPRAGDGRGGPAPGAAEEPLRRPLGPRPLGLDPSRKALRARASAEARHCGPAPAPATPASGRRGAGGCLNCLECCLDATGLRPLASAARAPPAASEFAPSPSPRAMPPTASWRQDSGAGAGASALAARRGAQAPARLKLVARFTGVRASDRVVAFAPPSRRPAKRARPQATEPAYPPSALRRRTASTPATTKLAKLLMSQHALDTLDALDADAEARRLPREVFLLLQTLRSLNSTRPRGFWRLRAGLALLDRQRRVAQNLGALRLPLGAPPSAQ